MKKFLICAILILVAFGIGFGWGYLKLWKAEKDWNATKGEMQSKISTLEKDLAVAKAKESLWEIPLALAQISTHLSEKNFGLATQSLDQLKETFVKAQNLLSGDWRGRFDFFLPGLEEIRGEAQNMTPVAKQKTDELRNRFEQALRSPKAT